MTMLLLPFLVSNLVAALIVKSMRLYIVFIQSYANLIISSRRH